MRLWPVLAALVAAAGAWVAPAHADIWGYVDERGVAHFAAEKLDERYELFFRGGQSFDTSEGLAQPATQPPAPAPVPAGPAVRVAAFFEISPGYRVVRHQVDEVAREQGLEVELLHALIATESGFDPGAVSPKGAIGLMQVMPATAERYGLKGDPRVPLAKKLADPRTNLRTGARYLRDLIAMFPGRLELALAAYNAGEGAVQRAGNRIPNYRETQNYVRTVLQLYSLLKPPAPPPAPPVVAPARTSTPKRIRMELPVPAAGTLGRRNMPPGVAAVTPLEGPGEPAVVVQD